MNLLVTIDTHTWAIRITERWRASVEAIFEVGRLLIEAKAALPHGDFGAMCASDLPFSDSTAQRLMAIARDNRLSNPAHVQHLPASWGTLYELTKLSDDEFGAALDQHIISPDMLRADAELIRPLTRGNVQSSDGIAEGREAQDSRQAEGVRPDGGPLEVGAVAQPVERLPTQGGRSEVQTLSAPGGVESSPSEAIMPGGGLAIAHNRVESSDGLDFFPTPPWATRALFEHVLEKLGRKGHCKYQRAWEPACGEGHMSAILTEYFRDVFASDICDYGHENNIVNFLTADRAAGQFDWIITNPPFNTSIDFVEKAMARAGTGVAMFVRAAWLEGVERYERIFQNKPPTLVSYFVERVPLHKGRWEPEGQTFTAYVWLVWIKGAEPRPPFWIPPGCRERLTKPDDAARFGKKQQEGEAA